MDRLCAVVVLYFLPLLPAAAAAYNGNQPSTTLLRRQSEHTYTTGTTGSSTTANGVRREGIDSNLHKYAAQRLLSGRSRTGLAYNVSLPPSLQGISCQVMRLRAGSIHRRGLSFNEFHIPSGVRVHTGGPFVLMIYKSIHLSLTALLYSLPPGYTLISPILGLLVYTSLTPTSFCNASSVEMNLIGKRPISITIPIEDSLYMSSHSQKAPLCAFFDINGVVSFSSLSSAPNLCSSSTLVDMALVIPSSSSSSSSAPTSSHSNYTTSGSPTNASKPTKASLAKTWKIALIAVLASFCGCAVMGATVLLGIRMQGKSHVAKMVKGPADHQENLHTSVIGHTRAPTAGAVRTKPMLETESLNT